ncbi:ATP-binding protein [Streptomyces sp. NPDC005004]
MGTVLRNLADNALRHGCGSVHVRAAVSDGRLRLTVMDEGPGFPSDFLPRAFDRCGGAPPWRSAPRRWGVPPPLSTTEPIRSAGRLVLGSAPSESGAAGRQG